MSEKCQAGCKVFTGNETRHHPHCVYYPNSLSKMLDDAEAQLAERDALIRDGITHLCSYCMDNKERSWDEMQRHIHSCEKHPLTQAESQLKEIAEALDPCLSLDELIDKISGIINREKGDG